MRVLESGQVQPVGADRPSSLDVRFVAATNDDLQQRVKQGAFRADLYFRLAQYTIVVPPLRDRTQDIPYLVQRFLEEAGLELRRPVQAVDPDGLRLLQQARWPGNVRELRNVIRQAVLHTTDHIVSAETIRLVLGGPVDEATASAAPTVPAARLSHQSLRDVADQAARAAERVGIIEALRETGGNKSQTAKVLKTDYKTLHLKMKGLGLSGRDFAS